MARNQNRMALIRKVHGMIDNQDLEKHRHSQDQVGALLGSSKERVIQSVKIGDMDGEWVSVNRVHMKKYVILYCQLQKVPLWTYFALITALRRKILIRQPVKTL